MRSLEKMRDLMVNFNHGGGGAAAYKVEKDPSTIVLVDKGTVFEDYIGKQIKHEHGMIGELLRIEGDNLILKSGRSESVVAKTKAVEIWL